MTIELDEAQWLDEHQEFSLGELVERSGLSEAEVHELVEYGVIVPTDPGAPQWTFCAECIVAVRTARRLRNDFDLGSHELALVLMLLDRVRDLEEELRSLRAQMPRRPA